MTKLEAYVEKELERAQELRDKKQFVEALSILEDLKKRYPHNKRVRKRVGSRMYEMDPYSAHELLASSLVASPALPRRPLVDAACGISAAIPCLLLVGSYLHAWISPLGLGFPRVRQLLFLLLIEFLGIHSTGVGMTIAEERLGSLSRLVRWAGLLGLYGFFIVLIAFASGDWYMPMMFLLLLAIRLPRLLAYGMDEDSKAILVMSFVLLLFVIPFFMLSGYCLLVLLNLQLPALGFTPQVAADFEKSIIISQGTIISRVFGCGDPSKIPIDSGLSTTPTNSGLFYPGLCFFGILYFASVGALHIGFGIQPWLQQRRYRKMRAMNSEEGESAA